MDENNQADSTRWKVLVSEVRALINQLDEEHEQMCEKSGRLGDDSKSEKSVVVVPPARASVQSRVSTSVRRSSRGGLVAETGSMNMKMSLRRRTKIPMAAAKRGSQIRPSTRSNRDSSYVALELESPAILQEESKPEPIAEGKVARSPTWNSSKSDNGMAREPSLIVAEPDASRSSTGAQALLDPASRFLSLRTTQAVGGGTGDDEEENEDNDVFVHNLVRNEKFEYLCGTLIILNSIFIGIETDRLSRYDTLEYPALSKVLRAFFCMAFVIELLLRFANSQLNFFSLSSSGGMVNIFDTIAVGCQVAEELLGSSLNYYNCSSLRLLRVLRMVRVLRAGCLFGASNELRTLVVSISDSIQYLFWTMLLFFTMTFMYAVYLTQLASDLRIEMERKGVKNMDGNDEELERFFGTLDRAMLSLYQAVSDGIHWSEVMKPLMVVGGAGDVLLFVLYMSFALFALTNVVIGIFVEAALRTADDDKKNMIMQGMFDFFLQADDDGSGTISWEEYRNHLHNPQLQSFLRAVDIDDEEALKLFHLLDVEELGEISPEDMVSGCLRLHGSAKAIEMAVLMNNHDAFSRRMIAHAEMVEEALGVQKEAADPSKPEEDPTPFHAFRHKACTRQSLDSEF
eukprot:TRINITY_DN2215_c2_g1_i2.p1 TRINITY_DN2215_c2_g1~~TRINITY_DN2215_c2_g1_i2.p1  ORF type:complete len:628 (+),score=138.84 TRINITY_DN2215_c2_g1_i2:154-2037(+)